MDSLLVCPYIRIIRIFAPLSIRQSTIIKR